MPYSTLLKYSALLILSQYVFQSEQFQPCLGTSKPKGGDDYTFALAQVDDYRDPIGPQEACFYSCGAQIVTQSSGRGDMSKLTLMDKAAPFLTASGFLKVGESYFLNHLGLEDEEGGNGIGCINVKPGNKITHYPKSHAICAMAKTAVCGFWGQQSIPPQPEGTIPKVLPSSQPPKIPPPRTVTTSAKPKVTLAPSPKPSAKPSTTTILTTVISVNRPSTSIVSVVLPTTILSELKSTSSSSVTEALISSSSSAEVIALSSIIDTVPSDPAAAVKKFEVDGSWFHLIDNNEKSLVSANHLCTKNQASVASVSSASFPAVSNMLSEMESDKVIIGAWNGDSYSLTGNNCLILQTDHGIFPGTCADASAILCQQL